MTLLSGQGTFSGTPANGIGKSHNLENVRLWFGDVVMVKLYFPP
jgi:hypothetical protein